MYQDTQVISNCFSYKDKIRMTNNLQNVTTFKSSVKDEMLEDHRCAG